MLLGGSNVTGWTATSAQRVTRIAVTGIGLVTPLGATREATWRGLRQGASGLRLLPGDLFPGAESEAGGLPPEEARPQESDRFISYAVRAAREALRDAGLDAKSGRVACVVGSSKGGVLTLARHAADPLGVPAEFLRNVMPGMASTRIAEKLGLQGIVLAEAASCATGVACIYQAAGLLRRGQCDAALAGASDASLLPLMLACYRNLGALAESTEPGAACRPFDRSRNGFLVGEGAAVVTMETEQRARTRGVPIYGLVAGLAMGSDASHETRPDPEGRSLARTIRAALARAEVSPDAVDYVNAHGTGTRLGDVAEAQALRRVFHGRTPVSSTKPQTGHMLGASAAVEAAIAFLALRDGWMPATLNLQDPDEECRLNHVRGHGRAAQLRCALSVSAGFGGHLGALLAVRERDDS